MCVNLRCLKISFDVMCPLYFLCHWNQTIDTLFSILFSGSRGRRNKSTKKAKKCQDNPSSVAASEPMEAGAAAPTNGNKHDNNKAVGTDVDNNKSPSSS
jgi:hypothetical protein